MQDFWDNPSKCNFDRIMAENNLEKFEKFPKIFKGNEQNLA